MQPKLYSQLSMAPLTEIRTQSPKILNGDLLVDLLDKENSSMESTGIKFGRQDERIGYYLIYRLADQRSGRVLRPSLAWMTLSGCLWFERRTGNWRNGCVCWITCTFACLRSRLFRGNVHLPRESSCQQVSVTIQTLPPLEHPLIGTLSRYNQTIKAM